MDIKLFHSGPMQVNSYLCVDEETKKGFILDPGGANPSADKYMDEQGYNIEYITTFPSEVSIIGPSAILEGIEFLTFIDNKDNDLTGVTEDKSFTAVLGLPEGVRVRNSESSVVVMVHVAAEQTEAQFSGLPVEIRNLNGLVVTNGKVTTSATVYCTTLQSLKLTSAQVGAYVDAYMITGPGTYSLAVHSSLDITSGMTVDFLPATIEITVAEE